jgi:tRNA (mo5U34)-methyltransferase
MQAEAIREARKRQDRSKELAEKGWYHSFELPDGTLIDGVNPLPRLRERFARFPIPGDLRGKRVLDIGAWDGWFSFEAERRGAEVTAIDCVEAPHFVEMHRKLSSKVDYRILEIYELPAAGLGKFDIVFMLGVLYHLRHPLLALETVCSLTTGIAIVESFVTDGDTWREHTEAIPALEFLRRLRAGRSLR